MRAILQRTNRAEVRIEGEVKGKIDKGLVIFLGVEEADSDEDIEWLSGKISKMRIFEDEERKMNKSLMDIGGRILLISQFTLHASVKKGNRPSFLKAAKPELSIPMYEKFKSRLEEVTNTVVETGEFGAYMEVDFVNDGPVTLFIDTKNIE